jgi:hypothetical protein
MFITSSQPSGNTAEHSQFSEPFMQNVNSSRTNERTNEHYESHEILGRGGGRKTEEIMQHVPNSRSEEHTSELQSQP